MIIKVCRINSVSNTSSGKRKKCRERGEIFEHKKKGKINQTDDEIDVAREGAGWLLDI